MMGKLMKKDAFMVLAMALLLVLGMGMTACGSGTDGAAGAPDPAGGSDSAGGASGTGTGSGASGTDGAAGTSARPVIEITMESGGVIEVELDRAAAPVTVDNFVKLVNEGFYDGLTFHRVIDGFMVQGGDPEGTGTGGSDENIKGEFSSNGWDNPISHQRGVISMARSNAPDSASSQFFITNGDASFLDGDYAAFGTVTKGMEVVDEIALAPKNSSDKPLDPVVIRSIRVIG
jgi:peptidyl-prolyl cis-trans isomerase B (cyclophilin B)